MTICVTGAHSAFCCNHEQTSVCEGNVESSEINSDVLAGLIARSVDGLLLIDADGIVRFANPAAEAFFSGEAAPLVGRQLGIPSAVEATELFLTQGQDIQYVELRSREITWQGRPASLASLRDVTERKRYQTELERSREELRNLTAHLALVREEERSAVASELHDDFSQALAVLNMDIGVLWKCCAQESMPDSTAALERIQALIDRMVERVRLLYTSLRPPVLDELGLSAAIEWQVDQSVVPAGVECHFSRLDEVEMPNPERRLVAFRAFQEALDNTIRHSGATRIEIGVERYDDYAVVQVSDNGRGITDDEMSSSGSMGLAGIREQLRRCHGSVSISRNDKGGTLMRISIPIH